jgi:tRNA threonylcarbamoyladenosine biosynthesis protein TsaB
VIVCAIETSGVRGGVALVLFEGADAAPPPEATPRERARAGRVLAEESYEEGLRHGRAVIPSLERCLRAAAIEKGAVDLFVAGTGPGSYTGLRVGVATGKGLAWALRRPLAGAPSFDALAASLDDALLEGAATLAVAADARKDRLYVALYDPGTRARRGDFAVRPEARLLEGAERPVVLAGLGLEKHPSLSSVALRLLPAHAPARALCGLGLAAHRARPEATLHDVLPIYLTAGVAAPDESPS